MLKEIKNTSQVSGEPRRRWFWTSGLDLVVWQGDAEDVVGFELCYGEDAEEAIVWHPHRGLAHAFVDTGEQFAGRHKSAPVLEPGGCLDIQRVLRLLNEKRGALEPSILGFICRKIIEAAGFIPLVPRLAQPD